MNRREFLSSSSSGHVHTFAVFKAVTPATGGGGGGGGGGYGGY